MPNADAHASSVASETQWRRQPVLWLGIGLLALSLVGCVLTIFLSHRFADPPVVVADDAKILNVPLHAHPRTDGTPPP